MMEHIYGETLLDLSTDSSAFMDLCNSAAVSDFTFDATLDGDLLLPMIEELTQVSQDPESSSPKYGELIDPDIFLNEAIKQESLSEHSSSPNRNTPSPSDSSKSFESYPSSGYGSCSSAQANHVFDSPPTSPEGPLSFPARNPVEGAAFLLPTTQSRTNSTRVAELRRVKIPPRRSTNSTGQGMITKGLTRKTIILTAKDYQALVKNIHNPTNKGTLVLKTTSASAFVDVTKEKHVLPRPVLIGGSPPTRPVTQIKSPEIPKPSPVVQSDNAAPLVLPLIGKPIDERAFKKHQRMIKNRESAFQSRIRKKEYVTTLEQQIDTLTKENQYLKTENAKLLGRLNFKCTCSAALDGTAGITKQMPTNMRKNTAIVLAMLFMVSFNFGPLGNLLVSKSYDQISVERTPEETVHHRRNLLWLDNSGFYNARNADVSLNLTALDDLSRAAEGPFSICPFYVNQTENMRLASELRRWIGDNGYKNLTDRDGDDMSINSFSQMFALKDTIDSMYRQMKDISSQMESFKKHNKYVPLKKRQQIKDNKKVHAVQTHQKQRAKKSSELAFYYPGMSKKYAKFFEEIGRRDDTFYLVSFSGEHLLLPALAYNKTNRPKMSLMLPALMDNVTHLSEKVTLMQIDCEVMNTSMIQIREKTIPGDLLKSSSKPEETLAKDRNKRNDESDELSGNNGRNSSYDSTERVARKRGPTVHRPYFVQRMTEHVKNEFDAH